MKNNKFLIPLILLFAFFNKAEAGFSCEKIYHAYSNQQLSTIKSWDNLPHSRSLPSKDFLHLLETHPVTHKLRNKFGDGSKIHLYNMFFNMSTDQYNGWSIQGDFLKTIFSTIFPKINYSKSPHANNFTIQTVIEDPTVSNHQIYLCSEFNMSALKAANPGPDIDNKSVLREKMNLPQNARIISIYYGTKSSLYLSPVINFIVQNNLADIIVVSFQKNFEFDENFEHDFMIQSTNQQQFTELKWLESHSPRQQSVDEHILKFLFYKNSEIQSLPWNQRSTKPAKPVVILNTTRGRMGAIHKASDLAIVIGAANFFEGLNVGTPTLFETLPVNIVKFEARHAWAQQREIALRTGGAASYNSIEQLQAALLDNSLSAPAHTTYQVHYNQNTMTSALDQILDQIDMLLESNRSSIQ